jgi:hypothetical protein
MAYLRQIEAINSGALNEDRLLTPALSSDEAERGLARDCARFTDSKSRLYLLSLSQRERIQVRDSSEKSNRARLLTIPSSRMRGEGSQIRLGTLSARAALFSFSSPFSKGED